MISPASNDNGPPMDFTDGRAPFNWKSRYSESARKKMQSEGIYLVFILFLVPTLLGFSASGWLKSWTNPPVPESDYTVFLVFFWAWLGGTFGGTLFSLKSLYHFCAKGLWNEDRVIWRYVTPHLSAGVSFGFIALVASGLLTVLDAGILAKPLLSFALAFLTGYFSDTALSKLASVANTLFGPAAGARDATSDQPVRQETGTEAQPRGRVGADGPDGELD